MLNSLPPPVYDEDKPTPSISAVKNPSTTAPQISSTGLFIPYTLNKKQQQTKKSATNQLVESTANDSDLDDDDDTDDQSDFLGLTKSNQIEVTNTDVESVLRETFPKARPMVVEQPVLPIAPAEFEDLDEDDEQAAHQPIPEDDDEVSENGCFSFEN